jgi:hypothetical protein
VVVQNLSDHADTVGVYLAVLPPGGSSNPGQCSPAGVMDLGSFNLQPGQRQTVRVDVSWNCLDPAAVDGGNWTLRAIADIHDDDFSSCDTLAEAFDFPCSVALADDDTNDANNTSDRQRPRVVSLVP